MEFTNPTILPQEMREPPQTGPTDLSTTKHWPRRIVLAILYTILGLVNLVALLGVLILVWVFIEIAISPSEVVGILLLVVLPYTAIAVSLAGILDVIFFIFRKRAKNKFVK